MKISANFKAKELKIIKLSRDVDLFLFWRLHWRMRWGSLRDIVL
jgi:hypothetical protein